jgi:hypothetical protein
MDYSSDSYTVTIYVPKTLDSKPVFNYIQSSSNTPSGAPRQLVSTLNTGLNRGT